MNPILPNNRRVKRKVFVSLSKVVFLCFTCLVLAIAAAWWAYRSRFSDESQLAIEQANLTKQVQLARMERERGAEAARTALARSRQSGTLAKIRGATNVVGNFLLKAHEFRQEALGLRTNELGRLIALHPELTILARRFYESEFTTLPLEGDIIQQLEAARRLEQQIMSLEGTAFEPPDEIVSATEAANVWANDGMRKIAAAQSLLSTIKQEAKVKLSSTQLGDSSLTLEQALQKLSQDETKRHHDVVLQESKLAQTNAAQTVGRAEAEKIIEASKREAEQIRRDTEAENAELARRGALQAGDETLKDAKAWAAARDRLDESLKVMLRKRASDPSIEAKLAPFTTPGYMDAYGRTMLEKRPHSYSVLKSGGALEPTLTGLQKIAELAFTRIDTCRPRWSFQKQGSRGWRHSEHEMEMVKEAQRLLVEFGPVLVEMGKLEP